MCVLYFLSFILYKQPLEDSNLFRLSQSQMYFRYTKGLWWIEVSIHFCNVNNIDLSMSVGSTRMFDW